MIEEWELLTALTIEQAALVVYGLDEYKTFGKVTFQVTLEQRRGYDGQELIVSYNKAKDLEAALYQDCKTLESYGIDKVSNGKLFTKASLYQWLVGREIEGVGVESLKLNEKTPSELDKEFSQDSTNNVPETSVQTDTEISFDLEAVILDLKREVSERRNTGNHQGIDWVELIISHLKEVRDKASPEAKDLLKKHEEQRQLNSDLAAQVAEQEARIAEQERKLEEPDFPGIEDLPEAIQAVIKTYRECLHDLPADMKRPKKDNVEAFIRIQGITKPEIAGAVYAVSTHGFRMGGKAEAKKTEDWRPLNERHVK